MRTALLNGGKLPGFQAAGGGKMRTIFGSRGKGDTGCHGPAVMEGFRKKKNPEHEEGKKIKKHLLGGRGNSAKGSKQGRKGDGLFHGGHVGYIMWKCSNQKTNGPGKNPV